MKKVTLVIVLAAALLCTSCTNDSASKSNEPQESSKQTSSVVEASSQAEESYIEATAGDFVFRIPESAKLNDTSKDGVITLNYSVQESGGEYRFLISSASKENGQKMHNSTVDYLNNLNENIRELASLAGVSSEVDIPEIDVQKISVSSIGGKEVSLGAGWEYGTDQYREIDISCFVNDKYYLLSYWAESKIYDSAIWNDFLNNIRPL